MRSSARRSVPPLRRAISARRSTSASRPRVGSGSTCRPARRCSSRPVSDKAQPVILPDTNVVSELMQPAPSGEVLDWSEQQAGDEFHLSAVSEAKLRPGVAIDPVRPCGRRAAYVSMESELARQSPRHAFIDAGEGLAVSGCCGRAQLRKLNRTHPLVKHIAPKHKA